MVKKGKHSRGVAAAVMPVENETGKSGGHGWTYAALAAVIILAAVLIFIFTRPGGDYYGTMDTFYYMSTGGGLGWLAPVLVILALIAAMVFAYSKGWIGGSRGDKGGKGDKGGHGGGKGGKPKTLAQLRADFEKAQAEATRAREAVAKETDAAKRTTLEGAAQAAEAARDTAREAHNTRAESAGVAERV